ncbi:ATP-binding cassette domain-containing protein [Ensifer sp. ENS05]|uniref:ABC transporter ATP-binding protein n=1 Tax=Ensifer sp. ENS05 TaxID=2769277 RepID=UPI00177B27CA|nr:oligopeptide/dipeptide ABC transporter ATP-binding protein [Ensifer sp. ENS05]MBD9597292.1 ATP-binding cassette domain-containing protein [Ensifer sp. ENS05]
MTAPIVELKNVRKLYKLKGSSFLSGPGIHLRAVDDANLSIESGEVVAVVGESGSGKSTLGRLALHLIEPTSGTVRFKGVDLGTLSSSELRRQRRQMQMIFQDPFSSLNPHMRISDMLTEVFRAHGMHAPDERRLRAGELLERVGLRKAYIDRFPHQFSGGQRQRVAIARALAVNPGFIVADEPVSALDVSVQAQVINLMQDIQRDLGLAMMFISHDLAVVRHIADRVAVMYLGRIIEFGRTEDVFAAPGHPYTEALLSSAPGVGRKSGQKRVILQGDPPSPISPPSGCGFRTRCRYATQACAQSVPELQGISDYHSVACIRSDLELQAASQAIARLGRFAL